MNWFQYTKKSLKKSKILQWLQLTLPIPIGIITAQLLSKVVSHAINGEVRNTAKLGICILCILIVEKLASIGIRILYEKTSTAALYQCRMELYRQFLSNPLDLLFASDHGAAVERLKDDFDCLTARELSAYPSIWTGFITAAAYFAYLSFQTLPLALILIAISALQILPPLIVKHFLQVNYDSCREIEAELSDFTAEGYHGFATIKLYDLKEWWFDRLAALHRRYSKIGHRTDVTATANIILNLTMENILRYGTYAVVGIFVLFGYASMQTGVTAITLSFGLYAAVNKMTGALPRLSVAKIAHNRLLEWTVNTTDKGSVLENGDILIDSLRLFYGKSNGESDTAAELSAAFSGENISVIKGENGIGKSTLFRTVTGLLPAESGTVLTGGKNPRTLAESQFPNALCYLPQEDAMFDFSAKELYQMLLLQKTDKALHTAAEFGLTEENISRTKIRELSGGERKKVFLSLALALKPLLLLLDEPTNSLDFAGKNTLKRCLSERGRGTVIITHDDIFDEIADKIYHMDENRVKRFSKP